MPTECRVLSESVQSFGRRATEPTSTADPVRPQCGEDSLLSCLLAAHPLQIRARRNELQPLLVTMTDGELLHAWRRNSTSSTAPHTIRTGCGALLDLEVWEFSYEASIFAVLGLKPFNLFPTLPPIHCAVLDDRLGPETDLGMMSRIASWWVRVLTA